MNICPRSSFAARCKLSYLAFGTVLLSAAPWHGCTPGLGICQSLLIPYGRSLLVELYREPGTGMENPYANSSSPSWSDGSWEYEPLPPLAAGQEQSNHQPQEVHSSPRHVEQTCKWIEACNSLHGNACVSEPTSQQSPEDVPLWLIDTHDQCIVPGLSAHRYPALSYVWPESRGSSDSSAPPPRTLLLDDASITDFQQPGFLGKPDTEQRIPAVIKHAMEFTRSLGETHLWVDRLCIVQDDMGDAGTLSQVGKMDKIYSGAYLTIIAAAKDEMYNKSPDFEWPMFRAVESRRRRGRYHAMNRYLSSAVPLPEMNEEEIVAVMSARYVMLSRSRWATRGWTYQEQILCKEPSCSSTVAFSGTGTAACGTVLIFFPAKNSRA
jgi:hypothetical protein